MGCFEAKEGAVMYEGIAHHRELLFDTHCFTLLVFPLSRLALILFLHLLL